MPPRQHLLAGLATAVCQPRLVLHRVDEKYLGVIKPHLSTDQVDRALHQHVKVVQHCGLIANAPHHAQVTVAALYLLLEPVRERPYLPGYAEDGIGKGAAGGAQLGAFPAHQFVNHDVGILNGPQHPPNDLAHQHTEQQGQHKSAKNDHRSNQNARPIGNGNLIQHEQPPRHRAGIFKAYPRNTDHLWARPFRQRWAQHCLVRVGPQIVVKRACAQVAGSRFKLFQVGWIGWRAVSNHQVGTRCQDHMAAWQRVNKVHICPVYQVEEVCRVNFDLVNGFQLIPRREHWRVKGQRRPHGQHKLVVAQAALQTETTDCDLAELVEGVKK